MSWTDNFPIFTDEMVDDFQLQATPEERARMEDFYGVERVIAAQQKPHIVTISLFWKPVSATAPELPTPTRDIMLRAIELGLVKRNHPWRDYVQPILDNVPKLAATYPDVAFRVYLANDLGFLIPDLEAAGCEIYHMKHASIGFAPGGLWRILAFEEEGKLVTMVDADRMAEISFDIERTDIMARSGLGTWRIPVAKDRDNEGNAAYRPIFAGQMGMKGGLPVRILLEAFTWHTLRGNIPQTVEMPGCGELPARWAEWPNLYFDEWFLALALYPRLAQAGMITFLPAGSMSQFLPLDIEYVTWANPESHIVPFPVGTCCASKMPGKDFSIPEHLEAVALAAF
jgi:hypothetical protein